MRVKKVAVYTPEIMVISLLVQIISQITEVCSCRETSALVVYFHSGLIKLSVWLLPIVPLPVLKYHGEKRCGRLEQHSRFPISP